MLSLILHRLVFTFLVLVTNERLQRVVPQAPSEDPRYWQFVTDVPLKDALAARGILLGTAVRIEELRKDPRYRKHILEHFALLTPEYEGKMAYILPEPHKYRFAALDRLVAFAKKYNKRVRGHTLIWSGDLPRWFKEKEWKPEELRAFTEEYIFTVVSRYRGEIPYWDVVNEALDLAGDWDEDNPWYESLKEEYIPLAFHAAHRADPNALLFYNDFLIEGQGEKSDALYNRVKRWKEEGVPIHGIGFQCHLFLGFPDREEFLQNLKRFADLGLKIHLTEVDLPLAFGATPGKRLKQAILYRRLMDACLKVQGCEAFITWGSDDGHSWTGKSRWFSEPLLFSPSFTPKLPYFALLSAALEREGYSRLME